MRPLLNNNAEKNQLADYVPLQRGVTEQIWLLINVSLFFEISSNMYCARNCNELVFAVYS